MNVGVGNTLDVAVSDALVPNLQRLRAVQVSQNNNAYPIEYRIDKNPDWKVFLNIFFLLNLLYFT